MNVMYIHPHIGDGLLCNARIWRHVKANISLDYVRMATRSHQVQEEEERFWFSNS